MAETAIALDDNEQTPKRNPGQSLLSFFGLLALVLLFAFLLRTFVFQPYEIPSGSMEETIMPGDMVFSEKISYHLRDIEAGDIVTFQEPNPANPEKPRVLIKRCIALEGQTVNLVEGVVYVDNQPLNEPYTGGKTTKSLNSTTVQYPYTVPDGHIWVMGDNRTSSLDSRYFGAVPVSSVNGRAFFTYWPIGSIGLLE